jgi:hypothetical protein
MAATVEVGSVHALTSRPVAPSRLVAFDRRGVAQLRGIRIEARFAPGAALPQQVPTLVQRDLQAAQTCHLVIAQAMLLFSPSIKPVLIVDELSDTFKNLGIIHLVLRRAHASGFGHRPGRDFAPTQRSVKPKVTLLARSVFGAWRKRPPVRRAVPQD